MYRDTSHARDKAAKNAGEKGVGPQAVRAMVLVIGFSHIEATRQVGHLAVACPPVGIVGCRPIDPSSSHGVVDGRKDLHRYFSRIVAGEFLIDIQDRFELDGFYLREDG